MWNVYHSSQDISYQVTLCQGIKWVRKKGTNFLQVLAYSSGPPQSSGVLHLAFRDSFCESQSDLRKFFNSQWQSSNQWLFWLSRGAKLSTPLDLGWLRVYAGAFKKFVPFCQDSFFPLTKCEVSYYLYVMQGMSIVLKLKTPLMSSARKNHLQIFSPPRFLQS